MAQQLEMVQRRRIEVEAEIARLKSRLAEMETELIDLDTAGRVFARLSGGQWNPASPADGTKPKEPPGVATGSQKPMTALITEVLGIEHRRGRRGLEPKEIAQIIRQTTMPDVKSEYVSSIAWRMHSKGKLVKQPGTSLYALPDNVKAQDPNLFAGTGSRASDEVPEAQGVKASPGGGS